jgi:hypothetical protein
MSTEELLKKLPSVAYATDDKKVVNIGSLYVHNDGKDWVACYCVDGQFVCPNPDATEPPYNNAFAYGKTQNEALQGLYDWCVKNGFIKE